MTKVEPPAPGDTAPHFHSKAPHCFFGTFEEFSLFPEKFKVLGVISCPPGRELPVALGEGRLHPVPQSSVGTWGDTETPGKCHRQVATSSPWLTMFAHLTLEHIQEDGWACGPSPGPNPSLEPPLAKGGGRTQGGQGDTRHPLLFRDENKPTHLDP